MFRTQNELAEFLNKLGKQFSLAELLELVVINHPVYWFSAKTVISNTASDFQLTAYLDELFSASTAEVNATWRDTYRVVSQVRKQFLLPPERVKSIRRQARFLMAEYLDKPESELVVICDTFRLHYGSSDYFWYPLQKGFSEDIEARIGESEPRRASAYLVACNEMSREAEQKRKSLGYKAPLRWVEKVREEYLEKIHTLREMMEYELIQSVASDELIITKIHHGEGMIDIRFSRDKLRLVLSANGRFYSQHDIPSGIALEVVSQLVGYEVQCWAQMGKSLLEISDGIEQLQYKFLQWPMPRWDQ